MNWYRRGGKRLLDLAIVFVSAPITLPLAALTAAIVRTRLGSPVLFRQERPGRGGAPFVLLKFRTMSTETDSDGELLPDSTRLSSTGRALRSLSLDELPTLWLVLRGHMSLVGPRPLLMKYLDRYTAREARRHEVRPGVTGLAQTSGRNAISWDRKLEFDVQYVEQHSFRMDLQILLRTVGAVWRREGISQPGQATAEEFRPASRKTSLSDREARVDEQR